MDVYDKTLGRIMGGRQMVRLTVREWSGGWLSTCPEAPLLLLLWVVGMILLTR